MRLLKVIVFLLFLTDFWWCTCGQRRRNNNLPQWLNFNPDRLGIQNPDGLNNLKTLLHNIFTVEEHNEKYNMGLSTFKMKLNEFGNIANSDFVKIKNGYLQGLEKSQKVIEDIGRSLESLGLDFSPLKEILHQISVDWRNTGAVIPVRDQGNCGSCWAISAVDAISGQIFRKYGRIIQLSPQNVMDCSFGYGNLGCQGGYTDGAYHYVYDNDGVDTEASYPYVAKAGLCRYKRSSRGATVAGSGQIDQGNETQLMEVVANIGPVSAAMDASRITFQFYSEGVYYDPLCSSTNLDHAVLVVGFGTTITGLEYWIIQNSYGLGWGELGYFKLARNRDNHCGIASAATFPYLY